MLITGLALLSVVLSTKPAVIPATVNSPGFDADYHQVVLSPPPLETGDGNLLVSAADFLPLFGGSADWYKGKGILRGTRTAVVNIGSKEAVVGGESYLMDTSALVINDKLYVPLDLVGNIMGLSTVPKDGGTGRLLLPQVYGKEGLRFRYYPVYYIQSRYDPTRGQLQGELLLAYQNPYSFSLSKLHFNLPANTLYGNGAGIAVTGVMVDNNPVEFESQKCRLVVPLPKNLPPKRTVYLAISFTTTVPEGETRIGRSGSSSTLAGWYPILAPRGSDGWQGVADAGYGEPYFSDASYYRVHLELPSEYQVIASSKLTGHQSKTHSTIWTFNSEHPIREFTFAVSSTWQFTTGKAGPVQLVVASNGEPAETAMVYAREALEFFQEIYGPYPYSYLNIAFVPLENFAGMEYPGLVLLSSLAPFSPSVVVHEIAHQWWYNLVGNDSIREAWIDEGLAEYSTLLFYRKYNPAFYHSKLTEIAYLADMSPRPLNLPLGKYANEQAYRNVVYGHGVWAWLELEKHTGAERLWEALSYIQKYYRYQIINQEDLAIIMTYFGRLPEGYFNRYFGT